MSEATRTKLIGGLVLVVTGWGLYQILKLTGEEPKKSEKLDGVDDSKDRYEVVRVYKNSNRQKVLAPKLKREQAIAKVNSFGSSKTSMVIFRKL